MWYLKLREMTVLHRLTLCTGFEKLSILSRDNPLRGILSSIASPVFREFVLELGRSASFPERWSTMMEIWGFWRYFDGFFEERFARHGDFRLIIRVSQPFDREDLRKQAEWGFPLLAGRGCIYLETSRLAHN